MFFFFDLETTGFGLKRHMVRFDYERHPRIVQIGWLLAKPTGEVVNRMQFVIRPNGFEIPQSATDVHGISTEVAHEVGVDIDLILDRIKLDIDRADEIIAHNIQYDAPTLSAEFIRSDRADPLSGKRFYCTMRESKQFCGMLDRNRRPKMPSLKELHHKLFEREFLQHDAGSDSEAVMNCFFEMVRRGIRRIPNQAGQTQ